MPKNKTDQKIETLHQMIKKLSEVRRVFNENFENNLGADPNMKIDAFAVYDIATAVCLHLLKEKGLIDGD